jgi:penicillin-binding protein-related factor A (putative recombinase)
LTIKEKDIQQAILMYLQTVEDGYFWRNNNGGVFDPTKKVYRLNRSIFTPKGISDILGIYKTKMVAIEVKRPKCYATKEQKIFLKQIQDLGGIAFVARSVEDVQRELELG